MISPQPATAASPATAAAAASAASQPPWNSVLQLWQRNRLPSLQQKHHQWQKHQQRQEHQQQKQMTWTRQHRGQMRQRKAGEELAVRALESGAGVAAVVGAGAAAGNDGGREKGEGEVQEHDGVAGKPRTRARDMRRVLLLWPNIVDYVRIALLACTFLLLSHRHGADVRLLHTHVASVVCVYLLNLALDGVDGYIARRLNQQSSFGAFLDVVIDITTRTLMWTRSVDGCAGIILPCLEWLVFACTHAQAQVQAQAQAQVQVQASLHANVARRAEEERQRKHQSATSEQQSEASEQHADCSSPPSSNAAQPLPASPSLNAAPSSDARHLRPAVAAHSTRDAVAEGCPLVVESSAAVGMGSRDSSGVDWKANVQRSDAPPWVAAVMRNGFRTPIGVLVIAGLHFLPLWLWIVRQTSAVTAGSTHHITRSHGLHTTDAGSLARLLNGARHPLVGLVLLVGRVACASVEVWVVWSHAMTMIRSDGDALFGKSGIERAQRH